MTLNLSSNIAMNKCVNIGNMKRDCFQACGCRLLEFNCGSCVGMFDKCWCYLYQNGTNHMSHRQDREA